MRPGMVSGTDARRRLPWLSMLTEASSTAFACSRIGSSTGSGWSKCLVFLKRGFSKLPLATTCSIARRTSPICQSSALSVSMRPAG